MTKDRKKRASMVRFGDMRFPKGSVEFLKNYSFDKGISIPQSVRKAVDEFQEREEAKYRKGGRHEKTSE